MGMRGTDGSLTPRGGTMIGFGRALPRSRTSTVTLPSVQLVVRISFCVNFSNFSTTPYLANAYSAAETTKTIDLLAQVVVALRRCKSDSISSHQTHSTLAKQKSLMI